MRRYLAILSSFALISAMILAGATLTNGQSAPYSKTLSSFGGIGDSQPDGYPTTPRFEVGPSDSGYYLKYYQGSNIATSTSGSGIITQAISRCNDGDAILAKSGVYTWTSVVNDGGKNNIWIFGEGDTTDFYLPSSQNGFSIGARTGWHWSDFKIRGNGAMNENGQFILNGATNPIIERITSIGASGYGVRRPGGQTSYVTGLKVLDSVFNESGHNFLAGCGIRNAVIARNYVYKSGTTVDHEIIWLGASGGYGCYNNIITDNDLIGGHITINLDAWEGSASEVYNNTISLNRIRHWAPAYNSFYINAQNNIIDSNTIVDECLTRGQTGSVSVIQLTSGGGVGNIIRNNKISYGSGIAIRAAGAVSGSDVSYNRIKGITGGQNYQASISLSSSSNQNTDVTYNVVRGSITFANSGSSGNEYHDNQTNAPDSV